MLPRLAKRGKWWWRTQPGPGSVLNTAHSPCSEPAQNSTALAGFPDLWERATGQAEWTDLWPGHWPAREGLPPPHSSSGNAEVETLLCRWQPCDFGGCFTSVNPLAVQWSRRQLPSPLAPRGHHTSSGPLPHLAAPSRPSMDVTWPGSFPRPLWCHCLTFPSVSEPRIFCYLCPKVISEISKYI